MPPTSIASPEQKPLAILCMLAVLALLYATLQPFNPYPRNGVTWLPDANGLRFAEGGIVLSDGALQPTATTGPADSCAIEIYLRPLTREDSGNLLTFSSDENPDALYLRQWRRSLLLDRSRSPHKQGRELIEFRVDNAMQLDELVLVTVNSDPRGTTAYVDGKFDGSSPTFRIRPSELYRQIVLGNSPSDFKGWQGEIRGLAIYDHEISAAEAAEHYAEWSGGSPVSQAEEASHLLARYDFRERGGSVVHSEVARAPSLMIPVHFSIPRKPMLNSVSNEFEWSCRYRRDLIANIVGFMPLGFVLCGFFALSRSRPQAILLSTLCGGGLSVFIEFLQYYVPQRGSGWTDVITNTTGSLLGALIARPELVRLALRLVFLIPWKSDTEARHG
ncbi:MAG: VanZ family protein [Acidobacteria bacterium]|nr:VanZ family protein [Acidobacteriota bacterium]